MDNKNKLDKFFFRVEGKNNILESATHLLSAPFYRIEMPHFLAKWWAVKVRIFF